MWRKLGLVWGPDGKEWWAVSHAYLPTVDVLEDRFRVYVSCWDKDRVGRLGYVEVDINDPTKVLYVTKEPVLDVGEPGTFDEKGVSPCCVVDMDGEKRLYYFGWQRTQTVPYLLFCGLAVSRDGGRTFKRFARVPILDRTDREPWLRSAVTILKEHNRLRMWYVAGLGWFRLGGKLVPTYNIRYAESEDGIVWHATGRVCIDFACEDEFGFGRPWVVKDGQKYRMWYSIRSKTKPYRIGYAESDDGLQWTRRDDYVGIKSSAEGWDSEMICFPCVVKANGRWYMFYNGNGYGRDGFGVAVAEKLP
ncbi:MAG: hypothetical protein DRP82_00525 [Planctomycetota bacterium]|nr:MAG: hypothetical protein DRP82_00525 [Planctomycetota bacterium]